MPTANSDYKKGRAQYFETLARSVNGELFNPLEDLSVPDFAVMEDTHLNTYGAYIYTNAAFQSQNSSAYSNVSDSNEIEQASLESVRSGDETFNSWSAIVMRERGERDKALRCSFVQNFAVPPIPATDLYFALRMADGSDIIAPARKLASGEYEADIALNKIDKRQTSVFRLVYGSEKKLPLNAPLRHCAWIPAI
jgi:hypothetical protein